MQLSGVLFAHLFSHSAMPASIVVGAVSCATNKPFSEPLPDCLCASMAIGIHRLHTQTDRQPATCSNTMRCAAPITPTRQQPLLSNDQTKSNQIHSAAQHSLAAPSHSLKRAHHAYARGRCGAPVSRRRGIEDLVSPLLMYDHVG